MFRSGSGSGQVALNQRTIALDLIMLEMVARGRYGEVRKALYRESYVAVKVYNNNNEFNFKSFLRFSIRPKKNRGKMKKIFIKRKC